MIQTTVVCTLQAEDPRSEKKNTKQRWGKEEITFFIQYFDTVSATAGGVQEKEGDISSSQKSGS